MKRTTKYVALDVHQASTVTSVREESGRVIARSILPTEEPTIVEFLRGMRGALHVAFEVGTQSQWLHDLVAPIADRVVVCDGRRVARQGNKGDQVDADRLSELLAGRAAPGLLRQRAPRRPERTYPHLPEPRRGQTCPSAAALSLAMRRNAERA